MYNKLADNSGLSWRRTTLALRTLRVSRSAGATSSNTCLARRCAAPRRALIRDRYIFTFVLRASRALESCAADQIGASAKRYASKRAPPRSKRTPKCRPPVIKCAKRNETRAQHWRGVVFRWTERLTSRAMRWMRRDRGRKRYVVNKLLFSRVHYLLQCFHSTASTFSSRCFYCLQTI